MRKEKTIREKSRQRYRSDINYLQYFKLRVQRLIGRKTLCINHGTICTTDNKVTIGEDYHYREGGRIERVRLLDVRFRKFFLEAKLY
ncbi:MAG: hypothetical protein IH591_15155, partial [Bacteroidales bacterium]|nr:hypothetical protein [Bacteroidales bacterium]